MATDPPGLDFWPVDPSTLEDDNTLLRHDYTVIIGLNLVGEATSTGGREEVFFFGGGLGWGTRGWWGGFVVGVCGLGRPSLDQPLSGTIAARATD